MTTVYPPEPTTADEVLARARQRARWMAEQWPVRVPRFPVKAVAVKPPPALRLSRPRIPVPSADGLRGPLRAREIITAVAGETGIPAAAIVGERRTKPVFEARLEAIRRCADLGYSTTRLGLIFHRDHSTILYAMRKLGIDYVSKAHQRRKACERESDAT